MIVGTVGVVLGLLTFSLYTHHHSCNNEEIVLDYFVINVGHC
jgi:hypothetical protein